ncbi:MAG: DEAD/DEAH box helicase [Oligoflexus sp.]
MSSQNRRSSSGRPKKKGKGKGRMPNILRSKAKRSMKAPIEELDESHHLSPKERKQILDIRHQTEHSLRKWLQESKKLAEQGPSKEFRLDPWQQEAFDALLDGESVVVDAPTTAGKTRIIEAFFKVNLANPNFRAAYTSPVKSLSNDKLREFTSMFGRENVGIATGDIKENLRAPIVVATLESYRNSLLGVEPDLGRSLVVFDEYHFMQDTGRGSAWEEAMILTPPSCQLILLSASVENPEAFCQWIEKLSHRPCRLVRTTERPVPLRNLIFYKEQWLLADEMATQNLIKPIPKQSRFPLEHQEIARRLKSIVPLGLTPCIVYAGRRLSCESMASELCKQLEPLSPSESTELKDILDNDCDVENPLSFMKPNLRRMLLMYGVGYHHSGIAPAGRRAVEVLVKMGKLRFCVATMGLSIGINFSVRSALISDYQRPGEAGFTQYGASEVLQMLGRAGRRGRDVVGFSLWFSTQSYLKFAQAKREVVQSRLKNDPTTFLGLMGRGFKLRDIENFYEKSFLRFGDRKASFTLIRRDQLVKALGSDKLPCRSSARDFAFFQAEDDRSACHQCPFRGKCHPHLEQKYQNTLTHLHLHLHLIGCIDEDEKLTEFGSIARYFPQFGGLVIARLITDRWLTEERLLAGLELMAALSLARFKDPGFSRNYEFPYDIDQLEEMLEDYYPVELFDELYDPPNQRRDSYVLREFNPAAGFIVREWNAGSNWIGLRNRVCHEKFAEGDMVNLIYRAATYLQSLAQARVPGLGESARGLRDQLLRDPLTPAIRLEDPDEDLESLKASPDEDEATEM